MSFARFTAPAMIKIFRDFQDFYLWDFWPDCEVRNHPESIGNDTEAFGTPKQVNLRLFWFEKIYLGPSLREISENRLVT